MLRVAVGVGLVLVALAAPATSETPDLTAKTDLMLGVEDRSGSDWPRGIAVRGGLSFDGPSWSDRPAVTGGKVRLSAGVVLNGGRIPTCSRETLDEDGPSGCPKASIVGRLRPPLTMVIRAGPDTSAVLINGGPRRMWAYMTSYQLGLIKHPLAIAVKKLKSGRWSYELSFKAPRDMLSAGGVWRPVFQHAFLSIGGMARSPRYLSLTRCPKRGFVGYQGTFGYLRPDDGEGSASFRGRLACR